jgi:hypothetical protein
VPDDHEEAFWAEIRAIAEPVRKAVRLLRASQLGAAYEEAVWAPSISDGPADEQA